MKKLFLSVLAVALVSVAAFAQNNGLSQTVCEKFSWPQIIHRPRCFESKHCKNFPKVHCEDIYNNGAHGKLAACCWNGPRPGENGGRGEEEGGSGSNGLYYCTDPGAENMPKCTNPAQTDRKCCIPVYYKGSKADPKNSTKTGVKASAVKAEKPASAVKAPAKNPVKAQGKLPAVSKK